jgi:hypothetical protein
LTAYPKQLSAIDDIVTIKISTHSSLVMMLLQYWHASLLDMCLWFLTHADVDTCWCLTHVHFRHVSISDTCQIPTRVVTIITWQHVSEFDTCQNSTYVKVRHMSKFDKCKFWQQTSWIEFYIKKYNQSISAFNHLELYHIKEVQQPHSTECWLPLVLLLVFHWPSSCS